METTEVMELMPTTKAQVNSFVEKTVALVKDGIYDALRLKAQITSIKKACEDIDAAIKADYIDAAIKYGVKSFEIYGVKIELSDNIGTRYDYSNCGDKIYDSACKIKKEREGVLKALKNSISIVDADTGEVYKITPPVKYSSEGIKVTLI